jgi:hypothetical protein
MLYLRVCESMHLEEKDYFGLKFVNNENTEVSLNIVFFLLIKFYSIKIFRHG